jgi:hypothetical protein
MNARGEERQTIFHWEVVRRFPTVLPGFILISLLVHGAAFFAFQVVYPPQASMSAPPPAITVLDPQRPDHQALLRWIDAEDPTPAMSAGNAITDRLLQVAYKPSYATLRTPPLMLPEEPARVQFPPARDPLTIIRSVEPKPSIPPEPPASDPTRIVFTGDLGRRPVAALPPLVIRAKSTKELEPASFLVGVDARGAVQYVVSQSSSGNTAIDGEAADYLGKLKLAPGDQPISWGHVTIQWGPEAYTP